MIISETFVFNLVIIENNTETDKQEKPKNLTIWFNRTFQRFLQNNTTKTAKMLKKTNSDLSHGTALFGVTQSWQVKKGNETKRKMSTNT